MAKPDTYGNWYQHPRRKHVMLVAGLWLGSVVLLSAASTDFFTAPAKANNHAMFLLLVLPATWSLVEIVANYYRSRRPA